MWQDKTMGIIICLVAISLLFACDKQEEPQVIAAQKTTTEKQDNPSSGSQGEKVYLSTCSGCHKTGLSDAPKLGDKNDWSSLVVKDRDILVQNTLNGIGAMPPKGGNPSLSEDDIRAAVDYMIDKVR
ncbi:MAG TPA: c-type cytochrome [Geopsychrobacteraceae bacterium]|nr:c-type cytochrome [Geopsychrobacteraceae bacterium]